MISKANYHSHTNYVDGKNTPFEMAETAYNLGFKYFGFSEHYYNPNATDCCIKPHDIKNYYEDVNIIKQLYDGKMEVLLGWEVDCLCNIDKNVDYTIGSMHHMLVQNKYVAIDYTLPELMYIINVGYNNNPDLMVADYYKNLAEFINKQKPTVVGHFDLITKFNNGIFNPQNTIKQAYNAIDSIIANNKDIIFELNTGAIARGYKTEAYPSFELLKHLHKSNAKMQINSDCHNKEFLNCAFEESEQLLKSIGFNELYYITKQGLKAYKI